MRSFDNIFLSFLITWGIGLLPILIIRFLIVRRPIGKFPAGFTCLVFLIFNVMLFEALGSQTKAHGALMLVSFVSFYILRYKTDSSKIENLQKAEEASIENLDLIYCINCGARNKISAQRKQSSFNCKFCEHDLQKAFEELDKNKSSEDAQKGDEAEDAEKESLRPICTNCDAENESDAKYCRKCGEKLIESIEETVMYCEECGLEYGNDDAFCQKDGTKLLPKKSSK
jgi:ribosomal protein L40E